MTDKPKVTQAEGVGAFQKALRNAEPKHGEVVLHASDWMGLRDAIFNDAATIDRIAAEQSRDDVMFDWEDLEGEIEEALSDSFDVDWTARDGARHVVGLLQLNYTLRAMKGNRPRSPQMDHGE